MKSSVYISSEKIEVIGFTGGRGRVRVRRYLSCNLPEGTMMNGKIFDSAALVDCLSSLSKKKPKLFARPSLIVDGSSILSKRITAPKLNKRRSLRLVRDEFADAAQGIDELICDYYPLRDSGADNAIMACAVDKQLLDSYCSAFESAGIKLGSIRIGLQAVIEFVNSKKELQNKAFVLNLVDGATMLSMIFDGGANLFVSRSRLYGESKEQICSNMLDSLSGIIQFNKSQKFGEISHSYYMGLESEDLRLMDFLNPHKDITLSILGLFAGAKGAGKLPQEAHFVYLNALLDGRAVDLLRSEKTQKKLEKRERPRKPWALALALTAAVLVACIGWQAKLLLDIDAEAASLRSYLSDPSLITKSQELDYITKDTQRYLAAVRQHEMKLESERARASISNELLDLITMTGGEKASVVQLGFSEGQSVVHVRGRSATESDSADYIEALRRSELIKSINYTGYSFGSDGMYNFAIDVWLTVPLGEEES